jgi:hypothetical protein
MTGRPAARGWLILDEESPMAGLAQQEQGALQDLLQNAISRR